MARGHYKLIGFLSVTSGSAAPGHSRISPGTAGTHHRAGPGIDYPLSPPHIFLKTMYVLTQCAWSKDSERSLGTIDSKLLTVTSLSHSLSLSLSLSRSLYLNERIFNESHWRSRAPLHSLSLSLSFFPPPLSLSEQLVILSLSLSFALSLSLWTSSAPLYSLSISLRLSLRLSLSLSVFLFPFHWTLVCRWVLRKALKIIENEKCSDCLPWKRMGETNTNTQTHTGYYFQTNTQESIYLSFFWLKGNE